MPYVLKASVEREIERTFATEHVDYVRRRLSEQELPMDRSAGAVESAPRGTVTARHAEITGNEVVASGRIYIENATWYEPHDKTTEEEVFAVPAGLYDFLVLKVEFFATRDTIGSGPPQWELQPDGSWIPTLANISQDWERKTGAQYNWSVATLSLWPRAQSP